MAGYYKRMGRLEIEVSEDGLKFHDYIYGVQIKHRVGVRDESPTSEMQVSIEELRDLRYLLGHKRALV